MTAKRVYAAGPQRSRMPGFRGHHVLVSFAEPSQCALIDDGWAVRGWMLDSGAYSVWNSDAPPIDIDAYCAFIETVRDHVDGYIALDVIPGQPKVQPTEAEVAEALNASLQNLETMHKRGLRPIPVFHEGDPDWVLAEFVKMGADMICLAGTVNRGKPELVPWLREIFATYPGQRFHGLAMTQRRILYDPLLPFWSVDSTTWLNPVTIGIEESAWYFADLDAGFRRLIEQEMIHVSMTAYEYLAEHGPRLEAERLERERLKAEEKERKRLEAEAAKFAASPMARQMKLLDETA